jgi:hypothetical protein
VIIGLVEVGWLLFYVVFPSPSSNQAAQAIPTRVVEALIAVGFLGVAIRSGRARVVVAADGVDIVNTFNGRHILWTAIRRFTLKHRPLVPLMCVVELNDGTEMTAQGIQSFNWPRYRAAHRMVDDLNSILRERTHD